MRIGDTFVMLPPHVTIVPRIRLGFMAYGRFLDDLRPLAKSFGHIEVSGGDTAMFGQKNNTLVRLIDAGSDQLKALHNSILELMSAHELFCHDWTWAGEKYNPHTTLIGPRYFAKDETATFDCIYVVHHLENGHKAVNDLIPF